MQQYELMYILPARLENEEKRSAVEKMDQLVQKSEGTVISNSEWLVRKLSYPISHIRQGVFMIARLTIAEQNIGKLFRELKLNDEILRFQLLKPKTDKQRSFSRSRPTVLPQQAFQSEKENKTVEVATEEVSPEQLEKKLEELLEDKPVVS
jgi:small subunit ribosomal protein S6